MIKTHITYCKYSAEVLRIIDILYKEFLLTFKKKASIELYYGEYWLPENYRHPDHRYVVAYHENTPEQLKEALWMKEFVDKNQLLD